MEDVGDFEGWLRSALDRQMPAFEADIVKALERVETRFIFEEIVGHLEDDEGPAASHEG